LLARPTLTLVLLWFAIAAVLAGSALAAEGERPRLESFRGRLVTQITIAGNHVTEEWVISREIWTKVGKPLDPDLVLEDITRLENLAIFGSVEVIPQETPEGVALNFNFTEMPWIIPYPAVGYSEENGFSAGLGVSSPNFLGRDIVLGGSAIFGGATNYSFSATNPWVTGNHVSVGVKANHISRRNELLEFQQVSDYFLLESGKYLGENGRLKGYVGYYRVKSDQDGKTIDPDNSDELFQGGLTVGHDGRDTWLATQEGWHNELGVMYLGGTADSWSLAVDVRRYQPIGQRQTIATGPYLGLQTGTVDSEIPQYMQFFVGGANSVRGYNLEELGKEIFGKNQFLYTLEFRHLAISPTPRQFFKWSISLGLELAAFGDVGVAWSHASEFNLDRTRAGIGMGVRLLVPGLDSLRFDVARSEEGDTVFNFGVGNIFDGRKKRVR
jgi:outer membrane protein insertion porin family